MVLPFFFLQFFFLIEKSGFYIYTQPEKMNNRIVLVKLTWVSKKSTEKSSFN